MAGLISIVISIDFARIVSAGKVFDFYNVVILPFKFVAFEIFETARVAMEYY